MLDYHYILPVVLVTQSVLAGDDRLRDEPIDLSKKLRDTNDLGDDLSRAIFLDCRVAEYIPPRPVFARKPGGSKKVTTDVRLRFLVELSIISSSENITL